MQETKNLLLEYFNTQPVRFAEFLSNTIAIEVVVNTSCNSSYIGHDIIFKSEICASVFRYKNSDEIVYFDAVGFGVDGATGEHHPELDKTSQTIFTVAPGKKYSISNKWNPIPEEFLCISKGISNASFRSLRRRNDGHVFKKLIGDTDIRSYATLSAI